MISFLFNKTTDPFEVLAKYIEHTSCLQISSTHSYIFTYCDNLEPRRNYDFDSIVWKNSTCNTFCPKELMSEHIFFVWYAANVCHGQTSFVLCEMELSKWRQALHVISVASFVWLLNLEQSSRASKSPNEGTSLLQDTNENLKPRLRSRMHSNFLEIQEKGWMP